MEIMKRVKVLKGSLEVPRPAGASLAHRPLFDHQGKAISPGVHPGELCNLPADEANRLAAAGVVEIMPSVEDR
jgi:hypothetical protein